MSRFCFLVRMRAHGVCACMQRQLAKTKSSVEFRRSVGRSHYPFVDPSMVHKSVEYE